VVRGLLAHGHEVTALVGADLDCENLEGLPVKQRELELLDVRSVRRALEGCEAVVHTAACYSFWRPDPHEIYRVNVDGTRHVLEAARDLGLRRVVYTSTAGTLSPGYERQLLGDEEHVLDLRTFRGHYKTSKAMAEVLALREAARGLPVVIAHPTSVLGPGDRRPTPSGTIILHFLHGRMKVFVDMPQNLVDVRDVALGHVLALERGRPGERYVLGGENRSMREIVGLLAEITGLPAPRLALPRWMIAAAAHANEWIADHVTRKPPLVPREAMLHARDSRCFDIGKARRELGYAPRPAREVLIDAVRWFVAEGRCPPARAERIARMPAFAGAS
jgi:dihydroflavonol-4-reductase